MDRQFTKVQIKLPATIDEWEHVLDNLWLKVYNPHLLSLFFLEAHHLGLGYFLSIWR